VSFALGIAATVSLGHQILALREFAWLASDWAIVLLCAVLTVFAVFFFFVNERILSRPFQQFLRAIDEAQSRGRTPKLEMQRRDEWGLLAARLNAFLDHLVH